LTDKYSEIENMNKDLHENLISNTPLDPDSLSEDSKEQLAYLRNRETDLDRLSRSFDRQDHYKSKAENLMDAFFVNTKSEQMQIHERMRQIQDHQENIISSRRDVFKDVLEKSRVKEDHLNNQYLNKIESVDNQYEIIEERSRQLKELHKLIMDSWGTDSSQLIQGKRDANEQFLKDQEYKAEYTNRNSEDLAEKIKDLQEKQRMLIEKIKYDIERNRERFKDLHTQNRFLSRKISEDVKMKQELLRERVELMKEQQESRVESMKALQEQLLESNKLREEQYRSGQQFNPDDVREKQRYLMELQEDRMRLLEDRNNR